MLKLIIDGNTKGYSLYNIQKHLGLKQWSHFRSWLCGQTVGVYKNEPLIYLHDFERFIKDLPPLD